MLINGAAQLYLYLRVSKQLRTANNVTKYSGILRNFSREPSVILLITFTSSQIFDFGFCQLATKRFAASPKPSTTASQTIPTLKRSEIAIKESIPSPSPIRLDPRSRWASADRPELAGPLHSKIIIPRYVAAGTGYISQMRSGKISGIAAILTKSIFVTKLIYSECGRSPEPNSPYLTNPLVAQAPARLPNFINLSVAIQ